MPQIVNLDALISREDFEILSDAANTASNLKDTIPATDLEFGHLTYAVLRKPDFQRETAAWSAEAVADLVQSFIEENLIPSIILWRAPNRTLFVIDGAHRLSALIAWVNNDYGDGKRSRDFFQNIIPLQQEKAALVAREIIEERIGSYHDLRAAATYPKGAKPRHIELARVLGSVALNIQWVRGSAETAERSYFKINSGAVKVDDTELTMIDARRKPNALAARAIVRAGTGHKYWSKFTEPIQDEIEDTAHEVYDLLFKPTLETTTIKSLDVPVAGRGYSADSVKMIFALVNFVNRPSMADTKDPAPDRRSRKEGESQVLPDDPDGSATLTYLKAVRRAASRISGDAPGSLGLHPLVYFYGATGKFQPTAFLATIAFVRDLEARDAFPEFTEARARFEEFLHRYRYFVNQIGRNYGALERGLSPMRTMYGTMLTGITAGKSDEEIVQELQAQPQLKKALRADAEEDKKYQRNLTADNATSAFLREAMQGAVKCSICGARIHSRSMSMDHDKRRQDGGGDSPDNLKPTHPYCNTGYKERRVAQGKKGS